MYGLKVYLSPDDILNKLSDEDRKRFNECVFTDVVREVDGTITIYCALSNDSNVYTIPDCRHKYCDENGIEIDD